MATETAPGVDEALAGLEAWELRASADELRNHNWVEHVILYIIKVESCICTHQSSKFYLNLPNMNSAVR